MSQKVTNAFIDRVRTKFHYNSDDIGLLTHVTNDIKSCIKDQEGMEIVVFDNYAVAALTLGSNLDVLLAKYYRSNRNIEQLMANNILSELMLDGYEEMIELVEADSGLYADSIHFYGSEKEYTIKDMQTEIENLQYIRLKSNGAGALIPKMSVVCRINLCGEKPECKVRFTPCETCEMGINGRCHY